MYQNDQIRLRPASRNDVEFLVATEAAPDNATFIGQWPRDRHLANLCDTNFKYLMIVTDDHVDPLGYVILEGMTDGNCSLNIKRIVTVEKGRGIGRAAIRQIKELAFREFGIHRLWLDVKTFNARAKYIYETEGFKVEGTLRDCIKKGDQYESLTVLSILGSESNPSNSALLMRDRLVGTWSLAEFTNISANGVSASWQGEISGRLIYTKNGMVSVSINRFSSSTSEAQLEKNSFYAGRYQLTDVNVVKHIVEQASESKRIGHTYLRKFQFKNELLELSGTGLTGEVRLAWKKDHE